MIGFSFLSRSRTVIRSSRSDILRYLPHFFFVHEVLKLVEKGDDTIVAFELVVTFLETAHIFYDMKLLPAFSKIDPAIA